MVGRSDPVGIRPPSPVPFHHSTDPTVPKIASSGTSNSSCAPRKGTGLGRVRGLASTQQTGPSVQGLRRITRDDVALAQSTRSTTPTKAP